MSDNSYQNISLSEYSWNIFLWQEKIGKYIIERETSLTLRRPDSGVVSTDKESAILFNNRRKMPLTTSTRRSMGWERGQWGLIGYFWEATSSSWKTISDIWFLNNILGFKFMLWHFYVVLCTFISLCCSLIIKTSYPSSLSLCFHIWTVEIMASTVQGCVEVLTEHLAHS